jgi:hypothetical protein
MKIRENQIVFVQTKKLSHCSKWAPYPQAYETLLFLLILFKPCGFHALKNFYIIWPSNILVLKRTWRKVFQMILQNT